MHMLVVFQLILVLSLGFTVVFAEWIPTTEPSTGPTSQPSSAPSTGLLRDAATFAQVGASLVGDAVNGYFGTSISACANGTIVAIGAPGNVTTSGSVVVMRWTAAGWTQMGSTIRSAVGSYFGFTVSLLSSGGSLAICEPLLTSQRGRCHMRSWTGADWALVGSVSFATVNMHLGASLRILSDSQLVALAPHAGAFSLPQRGQTAVVTFFASSNNAQSFSGTQKYLYPPTFEDARDCIATASDMSPLVIGYPRFDSNGLTDNGAVHIRVQYASTVTTLMGSVNGSMFGIGVCINQRGGVLAVRAFSGANRSAQVHFYHNPSGWEAMGVTLEAPDPAETAIGSEAGGGVYALDGLRPKLMRSLLDVVQAQSRRLRDVSLELETARTALSERKVIDRAKGLLMTSRGVSEEDAYRLMRKTAMNQNKRIVDVAEAILSMSDILRSPTRANEGATTAG